VAAIAATDEGFLAVGSSLLAEPTSAECDDGKTNGRVWSSRDGDRWLDHADDSLANVRPQSIVQSGDYHFLFGTEICWSGEVSQRAGAWRSRDGVSWEEMAQSEVFNLGNIPMIVDLDGTLIGLGIFQEPPPSGEGDWSMETRVWSSTDGATWDHVATLDGIMPGALAAQSGVLIALSLPADKPGQMVVLRSSDGGHVWEEQTLPDGLPQSFFSLVGAHGRFVAAGDEVALVSTDGRSWTSSTSDPALLSGATALFALPDGYMLATATRADGAQSQQCYAGDLGPAQPSGAPAPSDSAPDADPTPFPTDRCVPVAGSGGTLLSSDGLDWRVGPDLPLAASGDLSSYQVAAFGESLVVAEMTHDGMIWVTPLDSFRP
jgi:hypothetical protein